ncbi:MAG TPA: NrsF family protein [Beijerinckiaceae bacterium]|nr:NrsF family protein [Beijerinckiaceae bacterium]
MKTDDLVRLLAADNAGATENAERQSWLSGASLTAGLAVSLMLFWAGVGLRADIGEAFFAIVRKEAVTLAIAAAGAVALQRLSAPEGRGFFGWMAPLALALFFVGGELASQGSEGWQARMIGRNGLVCLTTIPALSLPLLVGLLLALRRRAPGNAALAGAASGLAAVGIGASLYALHCTDDSTLFVAFWYSIAAVAMTVVGAVAGRQVLRW